MKFKRMEFFAALLGLVGIRRLHAQQSTAAGTTVCWRPPNLWKLTGPSISRLDVVQRCAVPNGECPVCGTMAEPYRPSYRLKDCKPAGGNMLACNQEPLPEERIIRCHRCNAAFWQDAEK
jgi:hypothetical protein